MRNLTADIIELPVNAFAGKEGLKRECEIEGCDGDVLMIRTDDLKLINGAYCTLCGQRYRFNSSFDGDELEQQLRQASTEE